MNSKVFLNLEEIKRRFEGNFEILKAYNKALMGNHVDRVFFIGLILEFELPNKLRDLMIKFLFDKSSVREALVGNINLILFPPKEEEND